MTNTATDTAPLFGRDAMMAFLTTQFDTIAKRTKKDLKAIKAHTRKKDVMPSAFLVYPLNNKEGEPLSQKYLKDFDINVKALMKIAGYKTLEELCDEQSLNLALDDYILFSHQDANKYVRLIIQGIEE